MTYRRTYSIVGVRHVLFGPVLSSVLPFLLLWSLLSGLPAFAFDARSASIRTAGDLADRGWNLYSNGTVGEYFRFRTSGSYMVVVRARGSVLSGVWPVMALNVDGLSGQTVSVDSRSFRDYRFRATLGPGVCSLGVSFLNDANDEVEDRNLYVDRIEILPLGGSGKPAPSNEREWAASARAREEAVLRSSAGAIVENRTGPGTITVLDQEGRPIPGALVTVEQKQHGFLFGSNIFMFDRFRTEDDNARYKARFSDLFNYATLPFFWGWSDPTYAYTDRLARWCTKNGIGMKGHPLLWQAPDGLPPGSRGLPSREAQKKHVEEAMQRYCGTIGFWEVVNEPSHFSGIPVDAPYRWARDACPQARLGINDYGALSDGNPLFLGLLKDAARAGVPFDAVGLQGHEPVATAFPLDRVRTVLDSYGSLGKRIQITELAFPSSGERVLASPWRKAWTEEQQADYVEKFYRVCFAHPSVEAIIWWDLSDSGAWLKSGGLLRTDLSPKPAYEALRRLIHEEWRTVVRGRTDERGAFGFSGFFGSYTAKVSAGDTTETMEFHLSKGGQNSFSHRIGVREEDLRETEDRNDRYPSARAPAAYL